MSGIMGQLVRLSDILEVVDAPLHDKLKQVRMFQRMRLMLGMMPALLASLLHCITGGHTRSI